ncbi:hypothetical protein LENED_000377 [Lentinula edodes]|uniref:Uncharacterized protein n=1 Tax=Lentinula edodes TaxID=5353 RepID=A0A1Q3DVC5_LENED|nr:hypothetical protein LENED_000377 [Lentinula edodes]
MFFAASLLILAVRAAASNVNIYHRIFAPGAPELPFVERGLSKVYYLLQKEGADRDVSSVKLCHIPLITSESIILHAPHLAQNNAPYAINYFVTPIPDDGACPRLGSGLVSLPSPFQALSKLNTTIIHKPDTQPPQPQLQVLDVHRCRLICSVDDWRRPGRRRAI